MSVSLTNQDYCICDQQDRSDGSVVGSEGKLKSTLSKSTSNETYETNVEEEEHDDEIHLNSSERIQNSHSSNFAAQLETQKSNLSHHSISHHGCSSSSSSSSSSSLLPSRASSGRHSTSESIIAEAPAPSIVLPRLQLPLPSLSSPPKSKPIPKKSASFSCMKAVESSNGFFLNPSHHHHPPHDVHSQAHNHPNPHSSVSSHPLHHHPSSRVPSRELKKGCSRITRSKSNLSLVKKHPLRHEFEFPRFNLFPHHHLHPHHHPHHDGQLLLPPGTFVGHQHHNHPGRKGDNSSINQYPLCVTCLQSNREGSTSFKLRKDFILEMQEERMRIQELMNRRKIRKQQKSNEKLALIAILLINVAFFISFCFLGMMFLRSVRFPTSS